MITPEPRLIIWEGGGDYTWHVTADAIRTAVIAAITTLVLTVAACGDVEMAYACATDTTPPVAADPARCVEPRDSAAVRDGVRWYQAPAADVADPDEQPVTGAELDGDWWSWTEQADLDDAKTKKSTKSPAKRKAAKP